jgi:hypothetical protein
MFLSTNLSSCHNLKWRRVVNAYLVGWEEEKLADSHTSSMQSWPNQLCRTERRSTVARLFAAAWYRWGLLLRRCVRSGRIESLGEAEAGSAGNQPRQGIAESKGRSHSTREGRCMSADLRWLHRPVFFRDVLIEPGFSLCGHATGTKPHSCVRNTPRH